MQFEHAAADAGGTDAPAPPRRGIDGWLRGEGGADAEQPRPAGQVDGPPSPLFAPRPRSDAPPAPPAPPARGWRTGKEEQTLDPVASIRLADALERMDPMSVRDALPALVPLARTLDPDERITALIQGWAKGLLCVAARTDRRILVVVDRFPEPLLESLDPVATGVHLYGPPGTDRVSVSIVDGNRLLEVTGVRDAEEARGLRHTPERSTGHDGPRDPSGSEDPPPGAASGSGAPASGYF